jgi:hypothetical protein
VLEQIADSGSRQQISPHSREGGLEKRQAMPGKPERKEAIKLRAGKK